MSRNLFDRELQELTKGITDMGHRVDQIMLATIEILKFQDVLSAKSVYAKDEEIAAMVHRIEQMCMNLIALQQPIAGDLRKIAATLKVITDMERISDQCYDICEILTTFSMPSSMKTPPKILQMFEKAREMFVGALDAFLKHDEDLARGICKSDDIVDNLFSRFILEMCAILPENRMTIPQAVDYMFIAKYIERIADHCAGVAEWAIFIETGEHPHLNRDRSLLEME